MRRRYIEMVFHSPLDFENSQMNAPARELALRRSGTDEIALLWHPEDDRVEVSVSDVTTGATFHIEVAPGSALDAFTHPYAYVASREAVERMIDEVVAPVDG
jgi:hypothetical protein